MSEQPPSVAEAPLAPEEVADRSFPTAFRGFDPVEVRAFLGRVADEVRRLHTQEAELRGLVEEAAGRPPDVEAAALVAAAQAEAEALLAAAQTEAAVAVSAARSEADTMLREAKERVATLGAAATGESARLLDEARAQAARIRSSATDELRARTEEAESAAVRRIAEAEREAATIRVNARAEADAVLEAARQRGREMVGEAQAARERMLADLARRKRAAHAQLEQLKASRDRLVETLKVARRTIDDVSMRFEAQDGPSAIVSGGASAPVTTTPGAPPAQARPRVPSPAEDQEPDRRPARAPAAARARGLAIGEAPPPASRPQIAAPQAEAVPEPEPAPPAPSDPVGPAPQPERETQTQERRSSALRILRRNRQPERPPPEPPHAVGRDSSAEGVRIIRGSAAEPPGEPAPAAPVVPAAGAPPMAAPAPEPEPQRQPNLAVEPPDPAPAPVAAAPLVEVEAVEVETVEERLVEPVPAATAPEEPAAELRPAEAAAEQPSFDREPNRDPDLEAEPLVPLAREEIRPRIEDLFARLRADREAAASRPAAPADPPAPNRGREPKPAVAAETLAAPSAVVTADRDEHLLQARDRVIEPLGAQLTRRLKRALQDEQNTTLDRLRTSRGQAQLDGLLPAASEQAEPYRRLALSYLSDAARAGAEASPFGPVPFSVEDLSVELGAELAGGLRARVRQVLSASASDDLDLSTMSDRISAVYREWKTQKVERLAGHFLVAAHERGRFVAHPEGTPLQWIVDDEGPCPDCDDNALAGAVPRGEAYPTGQLHPPAHLGCRCLLTPAPT
ncbi:MAG: DivIVA domain-containing protein [Actinobacteria bacterium]|nr:DivIVA domain-containing protein [Actinomycetota bacterium]